MNLGLKDKKGKDIEVGDIVQWKDGEGTRTAEVRFENGQTVFHCFRNSKPKNWAVGHKFGIGNFMYSDTEHHLTIIKKCRKDETQAQEKKHGE